MMLLSVACGTEPSQAPDLGDTSAPSSDTAPLTLPEATEAEPLTEAETETVTETVTSPETMAETQPETEAVTETAPVTEPETEPETTSPYLIPDPTRIDLSTFSKALADAAFMRGNAAYPTLTDKGIRIVARTESRDPSILWRINSMYEAAGYPVSEDGQTYVPFTPDEKKVIVLKVQAEWGGAFEMFYTTEDRTMAQSG